MNLVLLQKREELVKYAEKTKNTFWNFYHFSLQRLWAFLKSDLIIGDIMIEVESTWGNSLKNYVHVNNEGYLTINSEPKNKKEEAIRSFAILKLCAESENRNIEIGAFRVHSGSQLSNSEQVGFYFHQSYIEPFIDYLVERIDTRKITLTLLKNYKKRSEYFGRSDIQAIFSGQSTNLESRLKLDLYEYLFNCGINFTIEPKWNRSSIDILAENLKSENLYVEVKAISDSSKVKTSIRSGFIQCRQYLHDFSETVGFVVVYKNIFQDIQIVFDGEEDGIPFLHYDHKLMFFILIDVFDYLPTISQRASRVTYIQVSKDDIFRTEDVSDEIIETELVAPLSPEVTQESE